MDNFSDDDADMCGDAVYDADKALGGDAFEEVTHGSAAADDDGLSPSTWRTTISAGFDRGVLLAIVAQPRSTRGR